ncbi:MAG: CAP domain-containing protein [Planctomycetaceae bacterium]|nr:CAP domain-containing protein [Planctomycetaceae bacterium]
MLTRTGISIRIFIFAALAMQAAAYTTTTEAGPFRRLFQPNYTTKSTKAQAGAKQHTTAKPVIPDAGQTLSGSSEKPAPQPKLPVHHTPIVLHTFSEYEFLGLDFSDLVTVLPAKERTVMQAVLQDHQPDYSGRITEKYPDVRPEVANSLVQIAEAVHNEKSRSEIGQIVRDIPIPAPHLKSNEVLAVNQELAPAIDPEEYRAVDELNRFRMRSGLRPCVIDLLLVLVSRGHSSDMYRFGFFSHNSPVSGKGSFSQRARQLGASASAENIYMGSSSGKAANNAWVNSSGHRANMLGGFSRVGVGRIGGYFTQMFGR